MSEVKYKDGGSPFIIEECFLSSSRIITRIEIKSLIADFVIYEHIEKPYLTGKISITDFDGIIQDMAFGGDEFIDIVIKRPGNSNSLSLKFHLDRIMTSSKSNEKVETYFFHMVSESEYRSNALNVNKYYTGLPGKIIQDIVKEFVNLDITNNDNQLDASLPLKVIIPNMSPLDAASWIKKRSITNEGMPFFLYQPLKGNNLIYIDLGSVLSQEVINPNTPFADWQAAAEIPGVANTQQILNVNFNNSENLYDYIRDGFVGANYDYYDTQIGSFKQIKLSIREIFNKLRLSNTLEQSVLNYVYPFESRIDDTFLSDKVSRSIASWPSSGSYNQGFTKYASYTEEENHETYSRRVAGIAIKNILLKSNMTVTIKGTDFLDNEENYGVGRLIRFLFTRNKENITTDAQAALDLRKSGNYLVMAASHSFSKNPDSYNVTLYCTKLESVDSSLRRAA